MMTNGYIEPKIKTGGGINPETGYPIPPSVSWGDPIPCHFSSNRYNNLGKANGEAFTVASYEIFIDEQSFHAEALRLKDADGRERGVFSVIEIESLRAVCQIRILV